jgi:hypothetical protein
MAGQLQNFLFRFRHAAGSAIWKLGLCPRDSAGLQPVVQFISKALKMDRLRKACAAASLEDALLLRYQSVSRHGEHRDFRHLRFLLHPCDEVETVFGAEIDIQ